jgi:tRNA G18 (ribose-2'-O)-methylase SpoU
MVDVAKAEGLLALVLGNEPHGLTDDVLTACAGSVTVETTGNVDSLNVAVAGSVALYEACRTRGASDA